MREGNGCAFVDVARQLGAEIVTKARNGRMANLYGADRC